MMRLNVVLLLSVLLFSTLIEAQHHDAIAGRSSGPVDLGKIDFPTSAGSADAQKHFIEGVLLLHSFEYARALRAFQEASRIDPDFAMAYWGEAMTHDHPVWGEQDRAAALAALQRLAPNPADRRVKARTDREKMYLDAVEKLYGDGGKSKGAADYSNAMAELTKRFPDDLEAQAFYSLSLLGLTGNVRNTENYMKGAAVAEAIYRKNPKHPGALHYLIHAYDDPEHAKLGLPAARAYGTVARSASHAQHMPSHIFFALGMWEDSIDSNTASLKTSRDEGVGGYHALHWLQHAYLQIGRDDEAARLLSMVEDDAKTKSSRPTLIHLALCRATMLVETRGKGPASMMVPVELAGSRIGALSNHALAMGLEFVRRNDQPEARRMLEALRVRNASIRTPVSNTSTGESRYAMVPQGGVDVGTVMEQILEAGIQFASGEREEALRKIVNAGEAENKLVFEFGPPAIVKPAWEAAGEMLLAAGRKKEAADAFRKALKRYPNRRLSNEGLKAATAG